MTNQSQPAPPSAALPAATPAVDVGRELPDELQNAQVAFGLKAQGKLEIVHRMRQEGKDWGEIANVIHWMPEAVERHYYMHYPPAPPTVPTPAEQAGIDVECRCAKCLDEGWGPHMSTPRPSRQRMVVCSICGNKRCPHAAWHGNRCTGSNASGQVPTPINESMLPAARAGQPVEGAEEIRRLRAYKADQEDFMAFMTAELAGFKCCHDDGGHDTTPPMMWPELISCIAARAVKDATAALTAERDALAERERRMRDVAQSVVNDIRDMKAESVERRELDYAERLAAALSPAVAAAGDDKPILDAIAGILNPHWPQGSRNAYRPDMLPDGVKRLAAENAKLQERLAEIDAGAKADAADLAQMRDGTKLTRAGVVQIIVYQQQDIAELKEQLASTTSQWQEATGCSHPEAAKERLAEVERENYRLNRLFELTDPLLGDRDAQARAWIRVWNECLDAGVRAFVSSDGSGATRAVEFIRSLATARREAEAAKGATVQAIYLFRLDCITDAQTDDDDLKQESLAALVTAMEIAERLGVAKELKRREQDAATPSTERPAT